MRTIALTVNGRATTASVEPRTHLADFLREDRNLTGTHLGCEHGVCGACTVLLDGVPARACITYAVACDGAAVTTVEGLDDEIARELREAFSREHALQCGYCTPGMLVSARDVVLRLPEPDEQAIRVAMSGNLCRCTGYVGIVRAVAAVIAERRARGVAAIPGGGVTSLGPAGSAGTAAEAEAPSPLRRRSEPPRVEGHPAPRPREGWRPQVTFEQSFTVAHPLTAVWEMFGDVRAVAACLPGAALTGEPAEDRVEGRIRVKAGPIAADFAGTAEIWRDVAHSAGMIRGAGRDARSGSATRGEIAYKLAPLEDGRATQVDVTVGYTLTGALAQFGRPGLVKEIAGRLTEAFARNLEERLARRAAGEDVSSAPAAELNAVSLVLGVIVSRVRSFVSRLLGR